MKVASLSMFHFALCLKDVEKRSCKVDNIHRRARLSKSRFSKRKVLTLLFEIDSTVSKLEKVFDEAKFRICN